MFLMTKGKEFEFEAFEGVIIDIRDLSVKGVFCLMKGLEGLEDIGQEIGVGKRKIPW